MHSGSTAPPLLEPLGPRAGGAAGGAAAEGGLTLATSMGWDLGWGLGSLGLKLDFKLGWGRKAPTLQVGVIPREGVITRERTA